MKKNINALIIALYCVIFNTAFALEATKVELPDKRIAVISHGEFEPASIGSYSIAIYTDETFLNFKMGAIFPRDGSVFKDDGTPRIEFMNMTNNGDPEMIVVKLTAGSGNHLEVDVLSINGSEVKLLAQAYGNDLGKIKDALKAKLTKTTQSEKQ